MHRSICRWNGKKRREIVRVKDRQRVKKSYVHIDAIIIKLMDTRDVVSDVDFIFLARLLSYNNNNGFDILALCFLHSLGYCYWLFSHLDKRHQRSPLFLRLCSAVSVIEDTFSQVYGYNQHQFIHHFLFVFRYKLQLRTKYWHRSPFIKIKIISNVALLII